MGLVLENTCAKFKDWRLPSKRELSLMYGVFSNGNGANLNESEYWNSTEVDSSIARGQSFLYGNLFSFSMNGTASVRAVWAF
tara:strand:- start:85 stop:330 length:246 start_codon:yes stop_codon:yes gene_type:complete